MDEPTAINTIRPPHRLRFFLRWAGCTLIVAGVFGASRLTAGDGDRVESSAPATRSPAPSGSTPSAEDPAPGFEYPGGEEQGSEESDDVLAAFDGLMDDLFGDQPQSATSTESAPDDEAAAGQTTTTGNGAVTGSWTIDHPDDWTVEEPDPGITLFGAPDYPAIATVLTRAYTGPLEDEAKRDLDVLMAGMSTEELISFENVEFEGREAIRAELGYTNPDGDLAAVNVIWIRDGDNLYVLAGEAPVDRADLQATVDQTLDSFAMFETA